jgi:hypothetical protein
MKPAVRRRGFAGVDHLPACDGLAVRHRVAANQLLHRLGGGVLFAGHPTAILIDLAQAVADTEFELSPKLLELEVIGTGEDPLWWR